MTTVSAPGLPSKFRTVERVICFRHSSTPSANDAKGASAATWRPFEGKVGHVWAPTEYGIENSHETAMAALQNARVREIVCLEYKNDFPYVLGLKSNVIPQLESTESGARYVMTMLPGDRNCSPQTLYKCDESSNEAVRWRSEYPEYNAQNISTHNVMEVKSHPVVFVDAQHPIISLLRTNKDLLQSDIDAQPLVQGRWHTVSKGIFNKAVATLRSKVLSNVSHINLVNFNLSLGTLEKNTWSEFGAGEHVPGIRDASICWKENDVNHMMKMAKITPYSCTARFKVIYDYPVA